MGHIEELHRKRVRRAYLKTLILGSIAAAGGLSIALIAPNVIGALVKTGIVPKKRQEEHITIARKRLKKEGALIEKNGFLRVSPKGLRQLYSLSLSLASPPPQKKWDEKWRIMIFDIPEHRRAIRNRVRNLLHSSGFVRVQHSVWLYPYPCEEFVALLKADVKVGHGMLYLIVDSLENDQRFREMFGLPRSRFLLPEPIPLPKVVEMLIDPLLPKYNRSMRPH